METGNRRVSESVDYPSTNAKNFSGNNAKDYWYNKYWFRNVD